MFSNKGFYRQSIRTLVVDDGSTNQTPEILKKFPPRVRILTKPNGGQASAFNFAIPEPIARSRSPSSMATTGGSGKLSAIVEAVNANPAVGLIGHGIIRSFCRRPRAHRHAARRFAISSQHRCGRGNLPHAQMFPRHQPYGLPRGNPPPNEARTETLKFEADEYLFTL